MFIGYVLLHLLGSYVVETGSSVASFWTPFFRFVIVGFGVTEFLLISDCAQENTEAFVPKDSYWMSLTRYLLLNAL